MKNHVLQYKEFIIYTILCNVMINLALILILLISLSSNVDQSLDDFPTIFAIIVNAISGLIIYKLAMKKVKISKDGFEFYYHNKLKKVVAWDEISKVELMYYNLHAIIIQTLDKTIKQPLQYQNSGRSYMIQYNFDILTTIYQMCPKEVDIKYKLLLYKIEFTNHMKSRKKVYKVIAELERIYNNNKNASQAVLTNIFTLHENINHPASYLRKLSFSNFINLKMILININYLLTI